MTDNLKTRIAEAMHDTYEKAAVKHGWKTQESCRVSFAELPEANRLTMLESAQAVLNIVEPMIPKWMPIEDFSKYQEEETVLLYDGRHVVAGYFREEELSGFYYHDYPDDYNLYTIEPTHWQPLPTPPEK